MEIGPVFRAMMRNKIGVGLLIVEIAVTLTIVLNSLVLIIGNKERLAIPTGMDVENMMTVRINSFGEKFDDYQYFDQVIKDDMAFIRAQPGVISATPISIEPLIGGGSSTHSMVEGADESAAVLSPYYIVDEHFLDAMGLELSSGRAFTKDDIPPLRDPNAPQPENMPPTNVIITQDLAEAFFPDSDALGKRITSKDGTRVNVIVGIVKYMYTPYDNGASGMETRILFFPGNRGNAASSRYLVRAEPGALSGLLTSMESQLTRLKEGRLVNAISLVEIKNRGSSFNILIIKILSWLTFLLFLVTALGIYGMTSFSVSARTRQIGTRRALGARKFEIVRYFMVEISAISFLGLSFGLGLGYGLNRLLLSNMNSVRPLDATILLIGVISMWLIGLISAAIPAIKGARISPVIATRSV